MTDRAVTPPALAKKWGIRPDRVLKFIRDGELRAFDISTNPDVGRPRYRITADAIIEFENHRSAKPVVAQRRRKRVPDNVIEYF